MEGTSLAQHALTWLRAGSVAEERAVRALGYDERSHPQFFRNCYTFNSRGDSRIINGMYQRWRGHPRVFVSKERAVQDARILIYNPRLWEATKELAGELVRRGDLDARRIREVLAPYRVESAVQARGLKVWTPADLTDDERRAAGDITRLDSPRGRPRAGAPRGRGTSAQSAPAARRSDVPLRQTGVSR
ncbi:hypothetical protein ACIBFB_12645 [Nocardiopsis sp. NPDC050513]|uniref:hypothetical protein n=1 Tax=Nocardiopsis sp. NPDC050513 TaxID=3364338 RepID=UPI0037902B4A